MKTRWLDRRIAAPGPHLALCLSQQEFDNAMRHLRIPPGAKFVNSGAGATTHQARNPEGELVCVVCIRLWQEHHPIEVAGLLVHEAVHIWQCYAEGIGEVNPGDEQEAYAIQSIAQELMMEFARRMEAK